MSSLLLYMEGELDLIRYNRIRLNTPEWIDSVEIVPRENGRKYRLLARILTDQPEELFMAIRDCMTKLDYVQYTIWEV